MSPRPKRNPRAPEKLLAEAGWVRSLAFELARDTHEAEELVQDAYLAAWRTRPDLREGSLRGWFASVLRNGRTRKLRQKDQRAWHESSAGTPDEIDPEDALERMELQKRLAEALVGLEEPYRTAVILRHLDGLDSKAIAERTGCTPEAARQRVSRGLARLRTQLESELDGPGGLSHALAPLLGWPVARALPLPGEPAVIEPATRGWSESPALTPTTLGGTTMISKAVLVPVLLVVGLAGVWLWSSAVPAAEPPAATEPVGSVASPEAPESAANLGALFADPSEARAALEASDSPAPFQSLLDDVNREVDLHGRVLLPDGSPAAGARVEIVRETWREFSTLDLKANRETRQVAALEANELGEFKVALEPGRPFDVTASREGFAPSPATSRYAGEYVELKLASPSTLEGSVVTEAEGLPLAGVELVGWHRGFTPLEVFCGTTDEDGKFRFEGLTPGPLRIEVKPPAHAMPLWTTIQLEAGATSEQVFRCRPGYRVFGSVTDATTGQPIPGATVGQGWAYTKSAKTGSDGRYEILGFAEEGYYEAAVRAAGYASQIVPVPGGSGEIELDFELVRGASLRGVVLDPLGDPASGAYVAAMAMDFTDPVLPSVDWCSGTVGAAGRFELTGLIPGQNYAVMVRNEGCAVVNYELPERARDLAEFDLGTIRLTQPAMLLGTVVDELGRPLAGHPVDLTVDSADRGRFAEQNPERVNGYFDQRSGRTDDLGRFSFGGLPRGSVEISASSKGGAVRATEEIEIGTGEVVRGVEVVLALGSSIEGRVVDRSGVPVAGVLLMLGGNGAGARAMTGPDGAFRMAGLSEGPYRLEVIPTDLAEGGPYLSDQLEDLRPGEGDLELVLEASAPLGGVVIDAEGEPVSKATVVALGLDGEIEWVERTAADGSFEFALEEGRLVDLAVFAPEEGSTLVDPEILKGEPWIRAGSVRSGTSGLILQPEN